jgi:hypothetical protein
VVRGRGRAIVKARQFVILLCFVQEIKVRRSRVAIRGYRGEKRSDKRRKKRGEERTEEDKRDEGEPKRIRRTDEMGDKRNGVTECRRCGWWQTACTFPPSLKQKNERTNE